MFLWIDTETYSPVPIKSGTAKYASAAETMLFTWAVDDGDAQLWDITAGPMPTALRDAILAADRIHAHNAFFDRTTLNNQPWWRYLYVSRTKWRCTMAMLLAHGLPGGLDKACQIFKIDASNAKTDGKKYIKLFCVPQKPTKTQKLTRFTRETHPVEWAEFCDYAKKDINAMRAVYKACPKWNSTEFERDLWHMDQEINDLGFAVDVELATAAVRATGQAKEELSGETILLTGGQVESTTQRDKLIAYLMQEEGVLLPDLKAATLEKSLEDPELSENVKELLRIRLQASKSSTTKFKRVAETHVNGRLYGTLQYCAASRTGRWGGRIFQPHNLTRLDIEVVAGHYGHTTESFAQLPKKEQKAKVQQYLDDGVRALKGGYAHLIFDNVMGLASNVMRGVIIAPKGEKLVISALANIEGRKLAWLAGETWKLDAFAEFDAGRGADMYRLAYARAFGIDPADVTDEQRQIGKVMELALGYQGGVGAFVSMVATYGIDLEALARVAWPTIPAGILSDSQAAYARSKARHKTLGLSMEVWVVCNALTAMWRAAHPRTVELWHSCETAARMAICNPGTAFPAGDKLSFDRKGNWLRMRLPSGRYLSYPDPRIDGDAVHYAALSVYTKGWVRSHMYGGKWVENADQGSSRDTMAFGMFRARDEDYRIVLTVHDELVTQTPDRDLWNDKRLSELLATNHETDAGCPLAAKGFTTYRYRKD